jgi:galactokinase/mevalonate kinase-like predicted kinase
LSSTSIASTFFWQKRKKMNPDPYFTPAVQAIFNRVADWTAAAKLPGAGGGGYILFLAKDAEAASRIRHELTTRPPNPRARFVRMDISDTGLQVTRS